MIFQVLTFGLILALCLTHALQNAVERTKRDAWRDAVADESEDGDRDNTTTESSSGTVSSGGGSSGSNNPSEGGSSSPVDFPKLFAGFLKLFSNVNSSGSSSVSNPINLITEVTGGNYKGR